MIPKKFLQIIPLLLFLFILVGPATAGDNGYNTMSVLDSRSYSMDASDGYVIYQIVVDSLPLGSNQTHILMYQDQEFDLIIGSSYEWGGLIKSFRVTMVYPNGSSLSVVKSISGVSGLWGFQNQYKTTIQPVFTQAESGYFIFADVNLEVGIVPVDIGLGDEPLTFNPSSAIPFTAVSGTTDDETSFYVYETTEENFIDDITNYDPTAGLANLLSKVFQWSWDWVLGFLYSVPIIGPLMISFLGMIGPILSVGIWWLIFIGTNSPSIIFGIETVIFLLAAARGGGNIRKTGKNIINYNRDVLNALKWLIDFVWELIKGIIEVIANIVTALKPI